MFESKGKHEMDNKKNRLKGVSSGFTKFNFNSEKTSGSQSVYSELKLSDHLA